MSESEPTDQEMYKTINKRFELAEQTILEQKKQLEELKEVIKKNAEAQTKQENRIVGYCTTCGTALSAADILEPICPHCHDGKLISNHPPY